MREIRTVLIHENDLKANQREKLEKNLKDFSPEFIPLAHWQVEKDDEELLLLTYLGDEALRLLIPLVCKKEVVVAVLPHPEGVQSRIGFGVDSSMDDAITWLTTEPAPVVVDSMYCNDRLVFNNVIIGDTFQLVTSGSSTDAPWWKRMGNVMRKFWTLRPFAVKVKTSKNELDTAVAGIVVVQHGKGSLLSRLILENSFANDGRFHAFLISPRSLLQLLLFGIKSLFVRKQLPPFAAHIKTDEITFTGSMTFDFAEDGISQSSKDLKIKVIPKQVKVLPGRYMPTLQEKGGEGARDIYKIKDLPMKESARVMVDKKLPLIKHASTEEFQQLFIVLRSNATVKGSYLVLMILSTMLASFGIFANSAPVVIGAMILAPLMAPIISLSMATLRQDKQLILSSMKAIAAGLLAGFVCAMLITWITPINIPNAEILTRTRPNLLDLGIAVLSGIAGAYAHAREEIAKTLAGVAIAVALVPPLAVSGIGLAWFDWDIFLGAGLLLVTNLAGMVLAGAVTFLVMGYSPFHLAKKGVLLSLLFVGLLSLPLGLSFQRMVDEHNIVATIDSVDFDNFKVKEARVVRRKPLIVAITVTTDHSLSDVELDAIKAQLEEKLQRELILEITVAMTR